MNLREWYRSRHSSWVAIEWGGHRYTIADFALMIGGTSGHHSLEEIHGEGQGDRFEGGWHGGKVKAAVIETAAEWMAIGSLPRDLATIEFSSN